MLDIEKLNHNTELIRINGVLNAQNIIDLKQETNRILNNAVRLVILDVEKLEEIDSTGIGAILSLVKRMRQKDGDVKLLKLGGTVKKLFKMLRIDQSMESYGTLEEIVN